MKTKYNVVQWYTGQNPGITTTKRTFDKILENINYRWNWVNNNVSTLVSIYTLYDGKCTILMYNTDVNNRKYWVQNI